MTVDEALAIVELALDYRCLNKVQEIVFREAWEGQSYVEIAKNYGYETEYIKDSGSKLWKLLSQALGEKVKKGNLRSVVKRYLLRNQVTLHRNQVIQVNLSGANLTGTSLSVANLSEARQFGNFSEGNLCQTDLSKANIPDDREELNIASIQCKEGSSHQIHPKYIEKTYKWNSWQFSSEAKVKIAETLAQLGILFFCKSRARLRTTEGSKDIEPDFLICYQGKWGILEVERSDNSVYQKQKEAQSHFFQEGDIAIIRHYDENKCSEQPMQVVQDFLEILSQS